MILYYNDSIFDDFISEALSKEADIVSDKVHELAAHLARNLAVQTGQTKATDVYVRDLDSVLSYLNFLEKTRQHSSDNKLIVVNDNTGQVPPANAEDYMKYTPPGSTGTFYIRKSGILEQLNILDTESQKLGQEILKPLIGKLKTQIESIIHVGNNHSSSNLPPLPPPNDKNNQKSTHPGDSDSSGQAGSLKGQSVSYHPDGTQKENIKEDSDFSKDIKSIILPFVEGQDDYISPYNITFFIRNIYLVLYKHKDREGVIAGSPILDEFSTLSYNIMDNWNSWQNFLSLKVATAKSKDGTQRNISVLRNRVPYALNRGPHNKMETIFGSTMNAKEAADRLLQMLNLVQDAITSIYESPPLTNLFTKELLNKQYNKARSFAEDLEPFARS